MDKFTNEVGINTRKEENSLVNLNLICLVVKELHILGSGDWLQHVQFCSSCKMLFYVFIDVRPRYELCTAGFGTLTLFL